MKNHIPENKNKRHYPYEDSDGCGIPIRSPLEVRWNQLLREPIGIATEDIDAGDFVNIEPTTGHMGRFASGETIRINDDVITNTNNEMIESTYAHLDALLNDFGCHNISQQDFLRGLNDIRKELLEHLER